MISAAHLETVESSQQHPPLLGSAQDLYSSDPFPFDAVEYFPFDVVELVSDEYLLDVEPCAPQTPRVPGSEPCAPQTPGVPGSPQTPDVVERAAQISHDGPQTPPPPVADVDSTISWLFPYTKAASPAPPMPIRMADIVGVDQRASQTPDVVERAPQTSHDEPQSPPPPVADVDSTHSCPFPYTKAAGPPPPMPIRMSERPPAYARKNRQTEIAAFDLVIAMLTSRVSPDMQQTGYSILRSAMESNGRDAAEISRACSPLRDGNHRSASRSRSPRGVF